MKYFHLRYHWEDLITPMNPKGVDCRGGVTIGIENGHDPDVVNFSIAICSINDVYNRKIGRTIVNGRMKAGEYYETKTYHLDYRYDVLYSAILPKIRSKIRQHLDPEELSAYFSALG